MSLIPFDIGYKINVFRSKKQQENIKFNHFVKISVNIWLINIKALPLHHQIIVERLNYKTMDELQNIQNLIYVIRGQRVMLDFDLAKIYQVETKALNQAVKRNYRRFEGEEFMFQLTKEEWEILTKEESLHIGTNTNTSSFTDGYNLRSQFVTSRLSNKWGGNRRPPYAFSEIGVAMLSSVLKSEVAIQANRKIMKAFVSYRHLAELPIAATYLELKKEIESVRAEVNDILADQNDINESTRAQLDAISTALAELQAKPSETKSRKPIGFVQPEDDDDKK